MPIVLRVALSALFYIAPIDQKSLIISDYATMLSPLLHLFIPLHYQTNLFLLRHAFCTMANFLMAYTQPLYHVLYDFCTMANFLMAYTQPHTMYCMRSVQRPTFLYTEPLYHVLYNAFCTMTNFLASCRPYMAWSLLFISHNPSMLSGQSLEPRRLVSRHNASISGEFLEPRRLSSTTIHP